MKRQLLLSLALAAVLTTDVHAGCGLKVREARLPIVSHGFWRGIDLGDKAFTEPRVDLDLCGRALTTLGDSGVDANIEAWVPFGGDSLNVVSAQMRFLRYFDKNTNKYIALGVRESRFGGSGADDWSPEVSIEAQTEITIQRAGIPAIWPFIEIAHDFDFFEATFGRVGVKHSLGYTEGIPFGGDAVVSVSGSDYAGTFGWHGGEAVLWLGYRLRPGLHVEIGGGRIWAAQDIGPSGNWIGARIQVLSTR